MKLEIGTVLEGIYEVRKTFGGGGMDLVHCARHVAWNFDVAIKHPRPEFPKLQRQTIWIGHGITA
jgi:hypothetical protein